MIFKQLKYILIFTICNCFIFTSFSANNTVDLSNPLWQKIHRSLQIISYKPRISKKLPNGTKISIQNPEALTRGKMAKIKIILPNGTIDNITYRVSPRYLLQAISAQIDSPLKILYKKKSLTYNAKGKLFKHKKILYARIALTKYNGKNNYAIVRVKSNGSIMRGASGTSIYLTDKVKFDQNIKQAELKRSVKYVARIGTIIKGNTYQKCPLSLSHFGTPKTCMSITNIQCAPDQCNLENIFKQSITDFWYTAIHSSPKEKKELDSIRKCIAVQSSKQIRGRKGHFACKAKRYRRKPTKRYPRTYNIKETSTPCTTQNMVDSISLEIYKASKCLGIDFRKVIPIYAHESHFQPSIKSPSGALGIGQLTRIAVQDINGVDSYNHHSKSRDLFIKTITDERIINKAGCEYISTIKPINHLDTCSRIERPNNPRASILYSLLYLKKLHGYKHDNNSLSAYRKLKTWERIRKDRGRRFTKRQKELLEEELVQALYNGGTQRARDFEVFFRNPANTNLDAKRFIQAWRKHLDLVYQIDRIFVKYGKELVSKHNKYRFMSADARNKAIYNLENKLLRNIKPKISWKQFTRHLSRTQRRNLRNIKNAIGNKKQFLHNKRNRNKLLASFTRAMISPETRNYSRKIERDAKEMQAKSRLNPKGLKCTIY